MEISRYWSFELPQDLTNHIAVVFDVWAASANVGRLLQSVDQVRLSNDQHFLEDIDRWPDAIKIGETLDPELQAKKLFQSSNHPYRIDKYLRENNCPCSQKIIFMSNNGTRVAHFAVDRKALQTVFCGFPYMTAVANWCRERVAQQPELKICCIAAGERKFADGKTREDMVGIDCFIALLRGESVIPNSIEEQVRREVWEDYRTVPSNTALAVKKYMPLTDEEYRESIRMAITFDAFSVVPLVKKDSAGLYVERV